MTGKPTVVGHISWAQFRVLDELMRDGATNRQIARRLNLSEETVRNHMKALFAAAGCEGRTELAVALFRGAVHLRVQTRPGRGTKCKEAEAS